MDSPDPLKQEIVLEGLINILRWADTASDKEQNSRKEIVSLIEMKGGLNKIEELQNSPSDKIYDKTISLLEKCFSKDDPQN